MSVLQRVVLVEDDLDIAELARIGLEDFGGFHLTHYPSGEDALRSLKTARPDIIILDYRMPGLNGAEVLLEIRRSESLRDIPVVFMTASVMPQHVESLRQLGAVDVIAKPFDPLTLAERIKAIYTANS
ncbi:response regulator [Altererythrobacter sp. SALINAS58]|uniref:response regulator n=1 Tax=Alteripontixanthobacter muriae TaxID=2705546 RepID=UPI0015774340|nr:response regulator [Alteripontixanthobacter muriae]NTZ43978.1 response regulator [Alteripontixanthobacter muriae]